MSSRTEGRRSRKTNTKKRWVTILISCLVIIGFAVVGGWVFFQSHFWPTAEASSVNIGWMSVDKAKSKLNELNATKSIEITIGDNTQTIELPQRYEITQEFLEKNINKQSFSLPLNEDFQSELEEKLKGIEFPEGTPSADAKVEIVDGTYQIVEETYGTQVDTEKLFEQIIKDAKENASTTSYNVKDFYIQPAVLKDSKDLQTKLDTLNNKVNKQITLNINGEMVTLTKEQLESVINDQGDVDSDSLYTLLTELSETYGTRFKPVIFTNIHGVTKQYTNNGYYGWYIDVDQALETVTNAINGDQVETTVEVPLGGYTGQQQKVSGTYVEIDLNDQKMYFYQNGSLVVDTDVITGRYNKGTATVPGFHTIYYLETDTKLEGQMLDGSKYSVPVKYWMPLISKGGAITQIGIHDADYKAEAFGNKQAYMTDYGSNGCINTPGDQVAKIFENAYPGLPVIIYGDIYDSAPGDYDKPVEHGEVVE